MWLLIGAAAALVVGANWLRQPASDLAHEPTAVMEVQEGDKVRTTTITRQQCLGQPQRVWVEVEGGAECIAYVMPEGVASGDTAVLFFEGDSVRADPASSAQTDKMIATYRRLATEGQRRFGLPFIIVARPGLMGSSGFHLLGGRRDEGEVMNAAVDAIKQRHGLRRLVLAGQSGGSRVAAQLLVLGRTDILCAALGSGAFDIPDTKGGGRVRTNIFGDPGKKYLVPMHQVQAVAPSTTRRIFVIGDPRDEVAAFAQQRRWAELLSTHGHHAVLHEASAEGPKHHGLSLVALQVAGMCATGKSDAEIAALAALRSPTPKAP